MIKVRVWHKNIGEYVKPSRFLVIDEEGSLSNDDCDIEQFTGIKDKNKVDIFVGDIIELRGGRKPKNQERKTYITEVVFSNGTFRPKYNNSIWNDSAALSCSTVIGNVNENPELLDGI